MKKKVIGNRESAIGYRQSVTGNQNADVREFWLLLPDYRLLTTDSRLPIPDS